MGNLKLTSSAFEDGGEIPRECGYKNGNETPSLAINGIPEGTKSLTLIMDDPDAMGAVGKVWVHWVVWNIDPTREFITGNPQESKFVEGMTDFGEVGYGGPAPPDKKHTYFFRLYAVDFGGFQAYARYPEDPVSGTKPTKRLSPMLTKNDLMKKIKGHILDQVTLTGTYAP